LRGAVYALFASAAALIFAAGLFAVRSLSGEPIRSSDPCALPAGIDVRALGASERDRVAERAMMCTDLEHGRISAAEYRARLVALDRRTAESPPAPVAEVVWASSVRDVSTQYTADSWSARQALGPPDALPGGEDSASAWASLDADSEAAEFLEVGFSGGHRMSGVDILESFNPGAVSRVELLLAGGQRMLVHQAAAAPQQQAQLRRRIDFACTEQAVIGVRVTLDSDAVPGWNEIDAIGGRPCAE
jgi:hypothetical protein